MSPSRKTWFWIIIACVSACVVLLFAFAAAGVYFVTRHVSSTKSSTAEAAETFDRERARFKDQQPLIEVDSFDRTRELRPTSELPTSTTKPDALWVLAWDPDENRVVRVSLPFWILRLGRRKLDIRTGDRSFDLQQLNLDVEELERIGPSLVLDMRMRSGERVLVWTQ